MSFSIAAKYHFEHGTCKRSYLQRQRKTGLWSCDRSEATWIPTQLNNYYGRRIETRVIAHESCKNSRSAIFSICRVRIPEQRYPQFIPLAISLHIHMILICILCFLNLRSSKSQYRDDCCGCWMYHGNPWEGHSAVPWAVCTSQLRQEPHRSARSASMHRNCCPFYPSDPISYDIWYLKCMWDNVSIQNHPEMFQDSHKVSLVGILKLEPNQSEQMNNTFLVNIALNLL